MGWWRQQEWLIGSLIQANNKILLFKLLKRPSPALFSLRQVHLFPIKSSSYPFLVFVFTTSPAQLITRADAWRRSSHRDQPNLALLLRCDDLCSLVFVSEKLAPVLVNLDETPDKNYLTELCLSKASLRYSSFPTLSWYASFHKVFTP